MDYAIAIFFLGLMVTIVVAKGMLMANDYANSERDSQDAPKQTDKAEL
jgi:hypothetical protein